MNIIELFEELKIDKSNILLLSPEDVIRIEKQVNVEKRINPDIDVNVANSLILALKEYPQELYFVVSNRVLYNLFAKKSKKDFHFYPFCEKMKTRVLNQQLNLLCITSELHSLTKLIIKSFKGSSAKPIYCVV